MGEIGYEVEEFDDKIKMSFVVLMPEDNWAEVFNDTHSYRCGSYSMASSIYLP